MTQLHTLPQNIAVPQLEQPIPLLPWMNAPHPPTRSVVLLGLISMAVFIGGFSAWSFFAPLAEAAIAEASSALKANIGSSPTRRADRSRNCSCAMAITFGPVRC